HITTRLPYATLFRSTRVRGRRAGQRAIAAAGRRRLRLRPGGAAALALVQAQRYLVTRAEPVTGVDIAGLRAAARDRPAWSRDGPRCPARSAAGVRRELGLRIALGSLDPSARRYA